MQIKAINWLSRAADEAEVVVSDGVFECEAYSQPCTASIGDFLVEPLHIFSIRHAILTDRESIGFKKVDAVGLAQRVVAKVTDLREGQLSVGDIMLIAEDSLPGGIVDGDFIELECARIEIW